jgi:hypothetical protein
MPMMVVAVLASSCGQSAPSNVSVPAAPVTKLTASWKPPRLK